MNISIEMTPDLVKYLDKKTKNRYTSRSEVVRDAIRLMVREELRQEAQKRHLTTEALERTRDDVAKELLEKKYPRYL